MVVLGLAFFYFYSGGGPNQNSRFNLDRAMLERGQLNVDAYHHNTEDKAYFQGRYYCDKAPGASFVALPTMYLTRVLMKFVAIDPNGGPALSAQMHVATWTAATLPALLLCLLLFQWTRRKGYSVGVAVYVALAAGLASPIWVYATLFWGSTLAACCLVLAAYGVDKLVPCATDRKVRGTALLSGIACGAAVLTEFTTAPMACTLAVLLIARLRPWSTHVRSLALFALGASAMAVILGTYQWGAFGSPFHLGYASVEGFEGMKEGLFGVTLPSGEAIAGVIWGPRGLVATAPLLVCGILGHLIAIKRGRHRTTAVICLAFSIYPILLNTSYHYWDGGWTYGPRHSAPALPFLALGLAPLFQSCRGALRVLAIVALMAGGFVTLMAVSVHGMTPYEPHYPLSDLYWPGFLLGHFAKHTGWAEHGGPSTNLGLALGMERSASLYPLAAALACALAGLVWSLRPGGKVREGP